MINQHFSFMNVEDVLDIILPYENDLLTTKESMYLYIIENDLDSSKHKIN